MPIAMHWVKGNIQMFILSKNTLGAIKDGIWHDFDEE
jgi:hypothetical protein